MNPTDILYYTNKTHIEILLVCDNAIMYIRTVCQKYNVVDTNTTKQFTKTEYILFGFKKMLKIK